MMPTYRPRNRKRINKHGFRARMKTTGGRKALNRRRNRGTLASRGDDRPQVDGRLPERGERLPQGARIRHSNEIRGLLERGKRKRTRLIDVFFTSSPASRSRMGVIVPKHGRNIVDRNRLKRRLREICRRDVLTRLDEGGKPGDVLIRARREAYGAGFDDLRNEVHKAMEGFWSDES